MTKFLSIFFLFSLFCFQLSGQWQANGTAIYNSNSGNVGIGTTSPLGKLHILDGNNNIRIGDFGNVSIAGIELTDGNIGSGSSVYLLGWSNSFRISTNGFDEASHKFTILNDGNIGIGLTTPTEKLHINGKLRIGNTQFWDNEINRYNNDNLYIGYRNTANTILQANGGNVGIGTTSPNAPLEINSAQYDKGLIIGSNGKNTKVYLHVAGGDYGYLFMGGNTVIRGNGAESYFDGSIGVGTSPGNYKLNVSGRIRADEIVVNTTGADFVFEPTYKLRSLSELETFIRTNKHLPDIAPAKEMQENGISAGEMQAKLLQKVEELTLYVIEQNKIMQIQTAELEKLKEVVEKQKEKIEILESNRENIIK